MKILLFFLLLTFTAFSQPFIVTAIEPTSMTTTIRVGAVANNIKVGVNFDYQHAENLQKFTFDLGRRLYLGTNVEIIPTVEFGYINRDNDGFFTHGATLETAYFIKDNFAIVLIGNVYRRKDIDFYYESGNNYRSILFIGLLYKFRDPAATRW